MHIHPTDDQLKQVLKSRVEGPIVMINLLKFKSVEGSTEGAQKTYRKYMMSTARFLDGVGGRLLWSGSPQFVVIGDERDSWDQALLVEYPSRKAFLKLLSNPDYQKVHELREQALESSALIMSVSDVNNLEVPDEIAQMEKAD